MQSVLRHIIDDPEIWPLIESPNPKITYETPVGAPYRHSTTFDILPLTTKKALMSEEEKANACQIYTNRIANMTEQSYITIYTDASVNPETHKATYACAAFTEGELNTEFSRVGRISDLAGSMTTELYAIKEAVDIIFDRRYEFIRGDTFCIITDSMSGLQALKNTFNPDNAHCVLGIHQKLDTLARAHRINGTITWCPSHIGIPGNELADEMAGEAMNVPLDITETPAAKSVIKSKIRAAMHKHWHKACILGDFYSAVNPTKAKFEIPAVSRVLQNQIIKLRHNAYHKCVYSCGNKCTYCDGRMSTGHYMISCPVTAKRLNKYRDLLTQDEHGLNEDLQAASILNKISKTDHELLRAVLCAYPPSGYCEEHTGSSKFYHQEFMPP